MILREAVYRSHDDIVTLYHSSCRCVTLCNDNLRFITCYVLFIFTLEYVCVCVCVCACVHL